MTREDIIKLARENAMHELARLGQKIEQEPVALVCALYTTPPTAQRPWIGLRVAEVQLHALAHRRMVNAYYDAARETNIVTETFDAPGFYKDIEAALKEKNETR